VYRGDPSTNIPKVDVLLMLPVANSRRAYPCTFAAQGTLYVSKQVTEIKIKTKKHFSGMYLVMGEEQKHLAVESFLETSHSVSTWEWTFFALCGDTLWFTKLCPTEKKLFMPCLCRVLREIFVLVEQLEWLRSSWMQEQS